MQVLRGFLWLLAALLIGQSLVPWLPVALPAGVVGMLVLTLVFMLRGGIDADVAAVSQPLIGLLALLILPGVVEIFFVAGRFADQAGAILVALLMGTLASAASSLWLLKRHLPDADEARDAPPTS